MNLDAMAGAAEDRAGFAGTVFDGVMGIWTVPGDGQQLRRRYHTRRAPVHRLESKIRAIPDFPTPGVVFRDITPLVSDSEVLRQAIEQLTRPFVDERVDAVAGMEARGFIFGALAARELDAGFIPLRKPGKLPYDVQSVSYDLEYGRASLEAHIDAVNPGDRILLVDDLIATGGTASASCELVERLSGEVVACAFVIELDSLGGRKRLRGRHVHSLVHY